MPVVGPTPHNSTPLVSGAVGWRLSSKSSPCQITGAPLSGKKRPLLRKKLRVHRFAWLSCAQNTPGGCRPHTETHLAPLQKWAHFKTRFKNSPRSESGPRLFFFTGVRACTKTSETPPSHTVPPPAQVPVPCRWANTPQQHVPGVRCGGPRAGFKKWPTPNHGRHKAVQCWGQGRLFCTLRYSGVPRNTRGDSPTHTEGHLAPLQKRARFKNRFKNSGANNYFSVQRLGSRCWST